LDTGTDIILEVLAATEFNEVFSGRQPRQDVEVFNVSKTNFVLIFRVCWWFDSTRTG